jgi:hypothetical protein
MKDFKKMPKMACGGKVKKMAGGGSPNDITGKLKKYAPVSTERMEENLKSRDEDLEKGKYVSATAKTLKSAAIDFPKASMHAVQNRLAFGEKPEAKKKGGTIRRNKK